MVEAERDQTPNAGIVTVTYGDRAHLLCQTIDAVLNMQGAEHITKLVVVDNAASSSTKLYLEQLSEQEPRLEVISFLENKGSAAGFKAGLELALKACCDYIWLLDDDNKPDELALLALQEAARNLSTRLPNDQFMLLSLRTRREMYCRVAHGEPPGSAFPRTSSFLGFHVLDLPKRSLRKLKRPLETPTSASQRPYSPCDSVIAIPYGTYGGLYLNRAVVEKIGFPDERFYVYADDGEYTCRLISQGGKLFLVPASRVDDVEVVEAAGKFRIPFTSALLDGSDFKVYYGTRNYVYFEKTFRLKNAFIYHVNKYLFLMNLRVASLLLNTSKRYQLVLRAIQEGQEGQLGQRSDITP